MAGIPENILLFLSAFGTLQGCLLAAILYFHPKSDRSVTIFLALYIFFISIPSIVLVIQYFYSWRIIIFIQPFLLFIGPFLYLYLPSFTETITFQKACPHFVLFFLYLLISYWFYRIEGIKHSSSGPVPAEVLKHPLYYIQISGRSAQRIFYYFLSYKVLIIYQRSIRHLFSDTGRINLRWVRWLINGYLLLVLFIISLNVLIFTYPEYYNLLVLIIGLMVTVYVYMAAMKGISQPSLWQVQRVSKKEVETEMQEAGNLESAVSDKTRAFRKQALEDSKMDEIVGRINTLILKEKIYLEPELTLKNLAEKIQLPSYQVSVAINEKLKKNFYDLINSYRVEEAKRLLLDPKNKSYTILSVGFEAGFNSKTTFNTVFKKFTGVTPTDFRKKE